jgi:hypothetical protein
MYSCPRGTIDVSFSTKSWFHAFVITFFSSLVTRDTVLKSSNLDLFNGVSLVPKLVLVRSRSMLEVLNFCTRIVWMRILCANSGHAYVFPTVNTREVYTGGGVFGRREGREIL